MEKKNKPVMHGSSEKIVAFGRVVALKMMIAEQHASIMLPMRI
jgi:hypothetical protein